MTKHKLYCSTVLLMFKIGTSVPVALLLLVALNIMKCVWLNLTFLYVTFLISYISLNVCTISLF